jgi:hypothetical protein
MRQPPVYTSWLVTCPSPEKAQSLQGWLSGRIDPDRVLPETVRAFPNGAEHVQVEQHRLGDYFADLRLLPADPDSPSSFRLVFRLRPGAGRFWKDLMVSILQEIEQAPEEANITLDEQGDEEPRQATGAGR